MIKPKILIGSPIRQHPAILNAFLTSLKGLRKTRSVQHYLFVDDNQEEISSALLKQCAAEHPDTCEIIEARRDSTLYLCNQKTHYWREELIWKVAAFKDRVISRAREGSYDFLFLIDSDLVLHPETLEHLAGLNREIVSTIFWTKWFEDAVPLPQVWMSDRYNQFDMEIGERLTEEEKLQRREIFLERLRKPGTYEVGGLGACTLINREALQKPISFQRIKNLIFWGEDRHFCVRASALGIPLFVDTHYPAYHIYREEDLKWIPDFHQCPPRALYREI